MTHPRLDPTRRCMPESEWPAVFRDRWRRALEPADIFQQDGLAAHWSPDTLHKNRRGLGRFLTFCSRQEGFDPLASPEQLITVENVRPYFAELRATVSDYTIIARLCELHGVVEVIAPGSDWRWLNLAISNLRNRGPQARDKEQRLRPTRELFENGLAHMAEAEGNASFTPYRVAWEYQNGLMMALLAARPLRRTNFSSIVLGRHLIRTLEGYDLVFARHEMKNRKGLRFEFPAELMSQLQEFLVRHRKVLLLKRNHDGLWIRQGGRPLTPTAFHHRIVEITHDRLGVAISPHLFRDAAATSISIEDPAFVAIAQILLGHTHPGTTRRYYIHARALEASRRLQECLLHRRQRADQRRSSKPSGGCATR